MSERPKIKLMTPLDQTGPYWCGYGWHVDCFEDCSECEKTFEKNGYNRAVDKANIIIAELSERIEALESPAPRNRAEQLIADKGAVEAMIWIREINGCTVCQYDYDYEDCLAQDNDCHAGAIRKYLEEDAE